jgi:epidermal growth factor receptor substrate 15
MAIDAFAGSFAATTSNGNQSVSSLSFQPDVVIFYNGQNTADGAIVDMTLSTGAAVSSSSRFNITANDEDGQATTDCSRGNDAANCIKIHTPGSTSAFQCVADFVSMDSNGFTVNWSNAPPSAYRISYLALGGSDLTNVATGQINCPVSTGDLAITGLGFQPDSIITFCQNEDADTGSSNHLWSMGFADGTNEGYITTAVVNGVTTTDSFRAQDTDACFACLHENGGSLQLEATLKSFDAGGFTLTFSSTDSGKIGFYVALAGGQYATGAVTTSTSDAGTVSTSSPGFTPSAGIFAGFQNAASAAIQDGMKVSVGAATATDELFVHGGTSEDAVGTSNADQYTDDALLYASYDYSQTLTGSCDLDSWDANGFTLGQVNGDPSAYELLYWVVGDDAAGGFSVSASDSITVAESVTVSVSAPQVDTTQATTISESVTVSVQEAVTLSVSVSDSVTVAESVSATVSAPQIDTTQAVTVAEVVAADVSDPQIDITQAITVSESVTVSITAIGTLSASATDNITVAEAITATVSAPQIDTTQAITVSESVTVDVLAEGVLSVSVSESVTVAEAISATVSAPQIDTTQAITVAESIGADVSAPQIDVSQAITVSESVTVSVSAAGLLQISVSESITVSETVTVSVGALAALSISVSESITVAESVTISVGQPTLQLAATDAITVSETVTLDPITVVLSVLQAIIVSESVAIGGLQATLYDITLSESLLYTVTPSESQPYGVTMSDATIVDVTMTDVTRTN